MPTRALVGADLSPMRSPGSRLRSSSLALLLGICTLILFAVPLDWGLRGMRSLAPDELTPAPLNNVLAHPLSTAWSQRYAPLAYNLLAWPAAPWIHLENQPLDAVDARRLALIARGESLLAALLTVGLLVLLGRRLGLASGAWLAGALWAASPVVVYYAKTANVDSLLLCAVVGSFLLLDRALERPTLAHWCAFAVLAAAASVIKEEAVPLFAAIPFLAALRLRHQLPPELTARQRWRHAILSRLWTAWLVGLAALVVFYVFPWHTEALRRPLFFLSYLFPSHRPPSHHPEWVEFSSTLAGKSAELAQVSRNLFFVAGLPAMALALIGLVVLARRRVRRRPHLPHLVANLTYVVTIWLFVGWNYDRFLLPTFVSVALLAGEGWEALWRRRPSPKWLPAALAISVLVWSGARAVEVDLALLGDSRDRVAQWVAERGITPSAVLALANEDHLAPFGSARPTWAGTRLFRPNPPSWGRLLVSLSLSRPPTEVQRDLVERIAAGRAGYHVLRRFEGHRYRWLDLSGARTNLDKIAPTILLLERDAPQKGAP